MAEAVKVGGEILVNGEPSAQTTPAITYLQNGGFVVTWVAPFDGDGLGIRAQLHDAAGNKVGPPFQVNTQIAGNQAEPRVTGLASGDFLVVWRGIDANGNGIKGQRFDSSGKPLGSEFLINTVVEGDQQAPNITALSTGGFVVGFSSPGLRPEGYWAKIYDASGAVVRDYFRVSANVADLTSTSDGGFLAASVVSYGSDESGIIVQAFGPNGSQGTYSQDVARGTAVAFSDVRIQTLSDGGFAVVWLAQPTQASTGAGAEIFARIYGSNGAPLTPAFAVTNGEAGDQIQPEVTAMANGTFVVTWTDTVGDSDRYSVEAQLFDNGGNRLGSIFTVNTKTAGIQQHPDVTGLADGRFAVTWQDQTDPTQADFDIRAQIFSASGVAPPPPGVRRGTEGPDNFTAADNAERFELLGGDDSVLFLSPAAVAGDVIEGGSGTDRAILRGHMSGGVVFDPQSLRDVEVIELISARDTRYAQDSFFYSYNLSLRGGNVAAGRTLTIDGSALRFGETMTVDAINETAGNLRILGGANIDYISGSSSDDYIRGGLGADYLSGNGGNDDFFYGSPEELGGDSIRGGAGEDRIVLRGYFSGGVIFSADQLQGIETIVLTGAKDTRFGPAGDFFGYNLTFPGGSLASGTMTTVDASTLRFGEYFYLDAVNESSGSLTVLGGGSRDYISGTSQGDVIRGGGGADQLRGNGGADVFRYDSWEDSVLRERDEIRDFKPMVDKIDLSRIDANPFVPGDQPFIYIGPAPFTGTPGELRVFLADPNANIWLVEGDLNGDRDGEFSIAVYAPPGEPLTPADFIF